MNLSIALGEGDGAGLATHKLANVFESDFFLRFENIEAAGGNDTLTGNSAANHIDGGFGNDTINGLGGDDFLEGFGGKDTLNGGDGDDKLLASAGGDTLNGGAGLDIVSYQGVSGARRSPSHRRGRHLLQGDQRAGRDHHQHRGRDRRASRRRAELRNMTAGNVLEGCVGADTMTGDAIGLRQLFDAVHRSTSRASPST